MRTAIEVLAALSFLTAAGSVHGFAQPCPPSASSLRSTRAALGLAAPHHLENENDDATTPSLRRRQLVASQVGSVMAMLLLASSSASPSSAEDTIDYSYLQDLLGKPDGSSPSSAPRTQTYVPKGSRPTYLVDPTEEFKANEAKAMDFKRGQLERKKAFLAALEKFEVDPNDEKLLSGGLDEMRRQVRAQNGLPLGVTKDELVKRIRRRKARRYWTTDIEISYQDLLQEIRYQQSPNTEKDMDNPF